MIYKKIWFQRRKIKKKYRIVKKIFLTDNQIVLSLL